MNQSNPYSQNVQLIYNGEGYCHVGNPCSRDNCDRCKPQNHSNKCVQIGTNCVFYGKDAGQPSLLRCLQIPNGTSLTTILEAIDLALCSYVKPDFSIFNYSCFDKYQIVTQEQFVEVVALELCALKQTKITLGNNYSTNDIVKVKFVPKVTPDVCGVTEVPRTDIDIELLLNTIKNTPLLRDLFCSICPTTTPTPLPVYIPPTPVYVPTPVYIPPTPVVVPVPIIVVPLPTPVPVFVPVPTPVPVVAPVEQCIKITNFQYLINGQANVNNVNFQNGPQDISVSVTGYQPSAYSVPVTYEFVLDFNSTGVSNTSSYVFPNVAAGNHTLAILVTNCGLTVRKDINFSIQSLPTPTPVPVVVAPICNCNCFTLLPLNTAQQAVFSVTYCDGSVGTYTLPVGGGTAQVCATSVNIVSNGYTQSCATNCCNNLTEAWNIQLCTSQEPIQKQVALSGNLFTGTVIKEVSTGLCYYLISKGTRQYPYIADYTVISGSCEVCLPVTPVCNWEDDTFFCQGVDRWVNQIDGCGNTRSVLREANSKHCGFFNGHIEFTTESNNSSNNPLQCPLGCNVGVRFVADTDYTPYVLNITWSAVQIAGNTVESGPTVIDPTYATITPSDKFVRWNNDCLNCNMTIRIIADVIVNGYSFQFTKDHYSRAFS